MKSAFLITAYKNQNQLIELINQFSESHFNIYVHLDKKSAINQYQLKKILADKHHVSIYRKFKVNWGSRNHLKAILFLAEQALKNRDNIYFHLITGQDKLVGSPEDLIHKLDISKDYLQHIPYPVSYLPKGATDWFEYYNFYDLLDAKKHLKYIRLIRNLQIKFGIKRSFDKPFPQKYYGSTYWSLTRETLQYVVDYTHIQPAFLRRLKHTFCAEELYFPTVVLNSPRAGNVVNDNLRFIKWEANGKTGSPKVLTDADWPEIIASGKLFARKFDE
jgi:hypothetical protein